ncbi:MAG: thermonuclease family protein [Pseudomonadota bacterium]|nr:thermonuclease family protein [Pseudomonadota bacterium]
MKSLFSFLIYLSLIFFFNYEILAAEYKGKVIKVIDGDTILVLSDEGSKNKIRLLYIDAPEIKQRYGIDSKKFLKNIVLDKTIIINSEKTDRYNRQLAEIYLYFDNKSIFVNAKMIKSGNAWVYKHDRNNNYLLNLENHARSNKLGLWSDSNPLEPWVYRKQKKY